MNTATAVTPYYKAIFISVALGMTVWVCDALLDSVFFYPGATFLEVLATDIPPHEIYIRTLVLVFFIGFGIFLSVQLKHHAETETMLTNVFNNVIPICITDNDYTLVSTNSRYREIFGPTELDGDNIKCYDSRPGPKCKTEECPLHQVTVEGRSSYTCESTKQEKDGALRHFIVTATPYLDIENKPVGIIETFQEITARRQLEEEREKLITRLQTAMAKVRTLSGFLPICASCKKIRDDKGYWTQIESYIKNHSEAEFSHSICPDCAEKLYGRFLENDGDRTEQ